MYYIAKFFQASGLVLLAYAFILTFPEKLNYRVLGVSIILFICGWIAEKYLLRK